MERQPSRGRKAVSTIDVFLMLIVCASLSALLPSTGTAQQGQGARSRLPVINKITSGGPTRADFTGSIQSLDRKLKVLNVSTANGQSTAIFPLGKKTKIADINGQKLRLAALTPGTNVVVYYEQSNTRRIVQRILVLPATSARTKKKTHSS
ncbi:MAG: hypothetical protein ACRD3O_02250 [Terriglobia bacterium]